MTNARQARERVIDAPFSNFPKCLVFSSYRCYSSNCRWVHCIPASLLQFSDLCWCVAPHTSQPSDVREEWPWQVPLLVWWAACSSCQSWASLRAHGQKHFLRWNPAFMTLLPLCQTDGQGIGGWLQKGRDGTLPKSARDRYSHLEKRGRQD